MKSTDNKKAQTFDGQGLIAVNKGILTMSNITQFSTDKQIQVSEHQLRRLLEFINLANSAFTELNALSYAIQDRLEKHTIAHSLTGLALEKSSQFKDECMEELEFFKQNSPQLVSTFSEELVA